MRNTRAIGGLAISVGAIIATSVASLAAFYAIGGRGPFGTINDVGNGTAGLLSAVLAWSLRRQGIGGRLGLVSAVAGGAVSVVGSLLVITNRTGWVFAGLVSGVGFALLGVWLFALNRALDGSRFPRGLRRLGTVAGGVMMLGFILVPAIADGVDDAETAPWWVWIGWQGLAGTYLLYTFWAVWLGRTLRREAE